MKKSTWQHLRIPFSFFLLPVFLFASSVAVDWQWSDFLLIASILHLLVYPASNGYNSYFDKDEKSIGGVKNPLKVSKELYYVSLLLDLVGLLLAVWIGWVFTIMVLIYGMVSKAYSHPSVRLKKYPILGWIVAGFFQGYFTFIMVYQGLHQVDVSDLAQWSIQLPALLSSMLLWGSYPMTQVYQHEEDAKRGDHTISLRLGVLGTFHFTAAFFSLANIGFLYYYHQYYAIGFALAFQAFLIPMLIYFMIWYRKVRQSTTYADFDHTMRLNMISSVMLNLFFSVMIFWMIN